MLFPRSFTGTHTKVKIRLFSSTEYLEYQQKIKNVFRYENKVFCYPFTRFFFKQIERVIPRRSCSFLFKKNKQTEKVERETPKEENAVPIRKNKGTNIYFQNIKTTCIEV